MRFHEVEPGKIRSFLCWLFSLLHLQPFNHVAHSCNIWKHIILNLYSIYFIVFRKINKGITRGERRNELENTKTFIKVGQGRKYNFNGWSSHTVRFKKQVFFFPINICLQTLLHSLREILWLSTKISYMHDDLTLSETVYLLYLNHRTLKFWNMTIHKFYFIS